MLSLIQLLSAVFLGRLAGRHTLSSVLRVMTALSRCLVLVDSLFICINLLNCLSDSCDIGGIFFSILQRTEMQRNERSCPRAHSCHWRIRTWSQALWLEEVGTPNHSLCPVAGTPQTLPHSLLTSPRFAVSNGTSTFSLRRKLKLRDVIPPGQSQ